MINAPRIINPGTIRVHGITQEMLYDKPVPCDAWPLFLKFIGKAPLIAHNARFNIGFIRKERARLGKRLPNKSICTLRLARRRYQRLPNHRLETVAQHILGTTPADCRLHRALGDAQLVAQMWLAMEGKR